MKPDFSLQNAHRLPTSRWLNGRIVMILVVLGVLVMALAMTGPRPERSKQVQHGNPKTNLLIFQPITGTPTRAQVATTVPESLASPTVTVDPLVTPSATPIPEAWRTNREMADGIVLGAVALVLIIVGGTLSVIRRKP